MADQHWQVYVHIWSRQQFQSLKVKKTTIKPAPASPHPESTKSNEGMVLLLYGAPPNPVLLYIASVNPLPLAAAAVHKLSKEVTTSIFQYFN